MKKKFHNLGPWCKRVLKSSFFPFTVHYLLKEAKEYKRKQVVLIESYFYLFIYLFILFIYLFIYLFFSKWRKVCRAYTCPLKGVSSSQHFNRYCVCTDYQLKTAKYTVGSFWELKMPDIEEGCLKLVIITVQGIRLRHTHTHTQGVHKGNWYTEVDNFSREFSILTHSKCGCYYFWTSILHCIKSHL